jgi:hypothetical protein
MSRKPVDRAAVGSVGRSYEGKTVRIQVMLRPEDASKLKLAALGLGLDLGDLVTTGLIPVLREIQAMVRVNPPALPSSSAVEGSASESGGFRVAG